MSSEIIWIKKKLAPIHKVQKSRNWKFYPRKTKKNTGALKPRASRNATRTRANQRYSSRKKGLVAVSTHLGSAVGGCCTAGTPRWASRWAGPCWGGLAEKGGGRPKAHGRAAAGGNRGGTTNRGTERARTDSSVGSRSDTEPPAGALPTHHRRGARSTQDSSRGGGSSVSYPCM